MNWREWYSNDTAWAVLRRGLIVSGICVVLAVVAHFWWGGSVWRYLIVVVGPVGLTVFNLLDRLGKEKKRDPTEDRE